MGTFLTFIAGALAGGMDVAWLRQRQVPTELPTETETPDALEAIKGIGAVYAARLQAAGIITFRQLAQTPPEQLKVIVEAGKSNLQVDTEAWIAQAEALAETAKNH